MFSRIHCKPYKPNTTTRFLKNYIETLGTNLADYRISGQNARKSADTPGYLPLKYAQPM